MEAMPLWIARIDGDNARLCAEDHGGVDEFPLGRH